MTAARSARDTRERLAAAAATRPHRAAESVVGSSSGRSSGRSTKYTLLLDQTDEDTIQDFVYHARHELGVPIDKSDAYRAFLALLRDDATLAGRVRDYIASTRTP